MEYEFLQSFHYFPCFIWLLHHHFILFYWLILLHLWNALDFSQCHTLRSEWNIGLHENTKTFNSVWRATILLRLSLIDCASMPDSSVERGMWSGCSWTCLVRKLHLKLTLFVLTKAKLLITKNYGIEKDIFYPSCAKNYAFQAG